MSANSGKNGQRVIVIGAGHNGLACAFDLARAGRQVTVLEAAHEIGGAAVTSEFASGHRVSACAHLLRSFPADLAKAMRLDSHGLAWAGTGLSTWALSAGAAPLDVGRAINGTDFMRRMRRHAEVLTTLMHTTPPRLDLDNWPDRIAVAKLGWQIRRMGREPMRELLRIAGMNVYDLLQDNLESTTLKGALGFDAVLGAEYGPRSPGTVLTWLQSLAGQSLAGSKGLAQPVGGIGALTRAMGQAVAAAGVTVRTGARVAHMAVTNDRVSGVVLDSGERLDADVVVSNADPRTTFLKLLGPEHLDTGFVRKIVHHRASGKVAKLHLALDSLPAFTGLDAQALGHRLVVSPSLDELERSFNPSKYGEIPERPSLEITVPTVRDASLAPAGKHVVSVIAQFVPFDVGTDRRAARARLLRNVLAVLEQHAPGIGQRVRSSEVLLPVDIEQRFGMTGGHWHHGALAFDQFFVNRPVHGASRYRAPIDGLYLCGAGSHPGGGLMGIAGRNAARTVLAND
jgi:phytoene dehydrogenase-like protein